MIFYNLHTEYRNCDLKSAFLFNNTTRAEHLTISSSHKNLMTISQTVRELSRWQTNKYIHMPVMLTRQQCSRPRPKHWENWLKTALRPKHQLSRPRHYTANILTNFDVDDVRKNHFKTLRQNDTISQFRYLNFKSFSLPTHEVQLYD